jgi:hypothetical protein
VAAAHAVPARRLAALVQPEDPEWFARELAIAAAPPWWFWRLLVRWLPLLPALVGRLEVTGSVPAGQREGPLAALSPATSRPDLPLLDDPERG